MRACPGPGKSTCAERSMILVYIDGLVNGQKTIFWEENNTQTESGSPCSEDPE